LARLLLSVLLVWWVAQAQVLPFQSMSWLRFPGFVPPFSFSAWALLSPRRSLYAPADLPKSHPASALRAHWRAQHHCTKRREFLGARASENLLLAPAASSYRSFASFVSNGFRLFIRLVTATDITVWIISALLAVGIGWSKYAKWKTRDKRVRELAAMDPERREKLLSRMNPEHAMEARQELMRRFHIS
jgi:hypothetical protein